MVRTSFGIPDENDAIGLKALLFSQTQFCLGLPMFVHQLTAKPITGRPALAEPQGNEPTLTGEHLCREFPAVFSRHCTFDAFDHRGGETAVVLKLLSAIKNGDACLLAEKLQMRRLVGVLEPAPTADVIYKYGIEIGSPGRHIVNQPLKRLPTINIKTAFSFVRISAYDSYAPLGGITRDGFSLILGRIFLVLRRHAEVLGGPHKFGLT